MSALSLKAIATILYKEAAKPLDINQARATFTIDGLTLRCGNTRSEIEAVATKYHKGKSCKTRQLGQVYQPAKHLIRT